MTRRIAAVLSVVALLAPAALAAKPAGDTPPPNPHIDRGVCPFECCTFREWKTFKKITLVDKPWGKTKVVDVPGETNVQGLTGDVYSVPYKLKAFHDYEDSPIKKGDTFYTLHAEGEGFWAVWYKGKKISVQLDGNELANHDNGGKQDWWVKIKTKDGKTGWVLDTGLFQNQDACG